MQRLNRRVITWLRNHGLTVCFGAELVSGAKVQNASSINTPCVHITALLCVLAFAGCGDESTTSPQATEKAAVGGVVADDYSLLLLLPQLANDLNLDAAQQVALATWRPDFHRDLRVAARPSGTDSAGTDELIERGRKQLKDYGERVDTLLSEPQKAAFLKLRASGKVSGIEIRRADSGQIGVSYNVYKDARKTRSRYRTDDALREISNASDAILTLAASDNVVNSFGARWMLENRDETESHADRLHSLLKPLVETRVQPRRVFIAAFCLLANRDDVELLTQMVESTEDDPADRLPALRVLIRKNPDRAVQLLRERLDDAWWRDESLLLLEELGPEAHRTLMLLSDVLHPNWREPIELLLKESGHSVEDSRVTEERIAWSIEQLCGDSPERREVAMAWLAAAAPAEVHRDTRVTCLLQTWLESTWDVEARLRLVTAYSRWAGREDISTLLGLLEDFEADPEGAGLAVDALLRLDPLLVRKLLSPSENAARFRAGLNRAYFSIVASRLPLLDDKSEPTLLLLYEVQEERLRLAVCRALSRAGTDRSVQILSQSLSDDALTDRLRNEITRTISRIRAR